MILVLMTGNHIKTCGLMLQGIFFKFRFSGGAASFFYDLVDPLFINAFVTDLNGDWASFSAGAAAKDG
jgi:hypothetical protein